MESRRTHNVSPKLPNARCKGLHHEENLSATKTLLILSLSKDAQRRRRAPRSYAR